MSKSSKISISLALTMGLPASGKTTLARKIAQFYKDKEKDLCSSSDSAVIVIVLSYDLFVPVKVQELCALEAVKVKEGGEGESMTKLLRRKFVQFVKVLVKRLQDEAEDDQDSLSVGQDLPQEFNSNFLQEAEKVLTHVESLKKNERRSSVILLLDDNHYYGSMRSELFSLVKQFRLGFCILYCKTSLKVCRERNSQREEGSRVPDRSIVEMSLKLEEPSPMGNECDAFSLVLKNEGELDEKMVLVNQVLESSLKNPVVWEPPPDRTEEIERERRICEESEVHQADMILRRWVSKEMGLSAFSNAGKGKRAEFAKGLNEKRTKALELLRTGEYKIAARVDEDVEFTQEVISLVSNLVIE